MAYADDVTLNGMDANKSVDNVGVCNLTNSTGDHWQGLCVDEHHTIYFGDTVPVTSGTSQVKNSTHVKQLITQYYRENMTAIEGANLQQAIWYFTDGKTDISAEARKMVNSVKDNTTPVLDVGTVVVVDSTTQKIDTQITSTTELIGTSTDSSNTITPLGNTTTVKTFAGDTYTKIVTTITEFFNKETTTNTIQTFKTTITQTDLYQTTTKTLTFTFNSVVNTYKQNLILFTAIPNLTTQQYTCQNSTTDIFNTTDTQKNNVVFNTTEEYVKIIPNPVITNNTSNNISSVKPILRVNESIVPGQTIPMQKTGMPLIAGLLGTLAIAGGMLRRKI